VNDTKTNWPTDRRSQYNLNLSMYYTSVEAGQNTSTVALRDGDLAFQVGGISNETVKYGPSSAGLGPKSDCSGKAQKQLYESITGSSSRQRGRPTARHPQLSNRKQRSGHGLQDRLTDGLSAVIYLQLQCINIISKSCTTNILRL
jgi:hypothetical protein